MGNKMGSRSGSVILRYAGAGLAAAALASCLAAGQADAAPYTHTVTGDLDGTLGAQSLTDGPFTWTLIASPAPITQANGFPALAASSDVLDISGIGTMTFDQPGFAVLGATASAFGFFSEPSGDGIAWTAGALRTHTLGAGIGPIAVDFGGVTSTIDTSDGTLRLTDASDLTFTGTIVPGAVPEPATLALLLGTLAMLGAIRRR